jgi:transcriptional regulator of acetoin/glycerol metabolism
LARRPHGRVYAHGARGNAVPLQSVPQPESTFTLTSLRTHAVAIPSLEVRATAPDGSELVVPLGMNPVVVGTSPDCDLVTPDTHVSRKHCELVLTDKGVVLRDLGSKNGTFVYDLEIHETMLRPNMAVRVGQWKIMIVVTGAPWDMPLSGSARFGAAIGGTLVMRALFARLEVAASTDETVLLVGESGTGKELLARAVHDASPRRNGPFAVFDCSAVAPTLIESELFGFVKGAFTGADRERVGIFEQANGGTLFLDEIGELPIDLQPKLLRALEARQFRRIGSNTWHAFDARVVAATHRDLAARMQSGEFRQDLYYRLAVLEARVPPLRERRDDIELLIERFLAAETPPLTVHDLPPSSMSMLRAHDWPGNVRELKNMLARILVFQDAGQTMFDQATSVQGEAKGDSLLALPLREARQQVIEKFEQTYLLAQLKAHGGNVTRAAEAVGVSRQFLHRLLERYRIRSGDVA